VAVSGPIAARFEGHSGGGIGPLGAAFIDIDEGLSLPRAEVADADCVCVCR
jgi:hypothetical protein